MPTIKDALDIIGKLTVAEQESLKTMLLSPAFVKSLNIEDFVAITKDLPQSLHTYRCVPSLR